MRLALRVLMWILIAAAGVCAILVVAIVVLISSDVSKDEVARVTSPLGDIDAVLVETSGGATVSFGYEVSLVPRGVKGPGTLSAFLYGATRNDRAYGANLRWGSESNLQVEFAHAKRATLDKPIVTVVGRKVQVELREGITDAIAPAGSMFRNLPGKP